MTMEVSMKLGRGILLTLALAATAPAYGKATVYVSATTRDSVGGQLVYEVREQIRRSSGMDLASSNVNAGYVLHLVTIKIDNVSTAFSLLLTRPGHVLSHVVGTCGTLNLRNCASNVVADTDQEITNYVDALLTVPPVLPAEPAKTGYNDM